MSTFGERLQQAAEYADRGSSQADIARALGINRQTVSLWFHGGEPNADMLLHAARIFGVDAHWLKAGEGKMHNGNGLDDLPADERAFLMDYRNAKPAQRERMRMVVRALRKSVVTIAAVLPGFMAPKDADAAICHNHIYATTADAQSGHITDCISKLRSALRKLLSRVKGYFVAPDSREKFACA